MRFLLAFLIGGELWYNLIHSGRFHYRNPQARLATLIGDGSVCKVLGRLSGVISYERHCKVA